MGVFGIIKAPLRLVQKAWSHILPTHDTRTVLALPVAGLDEAIAHQIVSTLRSAAHSEEDEEDKELANLWLAALETAQIASNRLVWDLQTVERNLDFWMERLRQGKHLRTMLFGQGPVSFYKDVREVVLKHQRSDTASDRIERRVIVLRALRTKLAEALAQVHAAASLLHLRAPKKQLQSGDLQPRLLLDLAKENVNQCAAITAKAYEEVRRHAQQEFRSLLDMKADLKKTALHQMLRPHSKKMFKVGSALDVADLEPVHQNGSKDREETDQSDQAEASDKGAKPGNAVTRLQKVLSVDIEINNSTSAHSAILQAAQLASDRPNIVDLPKWLCMPNKYAQNWIFYSMLGLGALYGGVFIVRHSRLVGSRDLEQWGSELGSSVMDAYQQHVAAPLLTVRNELFQTFRQKRSIVSADDFEADKESLVRMLEDFRKDNATRKVLEAPTTVAKAEDLPANMSAEDLDMLRKDLDFMMAHYEGELKKPIRNLVSGRLPRTLLIQVQKLKVDTEAAMLQLDQILRANELSIALVAAIPAFIVAGFTAYFLFRWIMPSAPDPKFEALPCRMAMVEVERAVQALTDGESAEEQGLLMFRLAMVYEEAIKLYRRHRMDVNTSQSEWRNLRADLIQLASPKPVRQKERIVKRVMRVYTIFRI